jgi:hypothetical protein
MRSFGLISYLFLGKRGFGRARVLTPLVVERWMRRLALAIPGMRAYSSASPRFLRHRSVTEGHERSRRRRSVHRLGFPVIVPLFLMLLVFAGALLHG